MLVPEAEAEILLLGNTSSQQQQTSSNSTTTKSSNSSSGGGGGAQSSQGQQQQQQQQKFDVEFNVWTRQDCEDNPAVTPNANRYDNCTTHNIQNKSTVTS